MIIFSTQTRPGVRFLALALALFGALAFVVRGYHDERETLRFRDFKGPYASARCLLEHCDPYSEEQTHAEFLAAGGVDQDRVPFDPYSALYPPFSLVALTPVAALPFPVTHALWKALIAALFAVAVYLVAELSLASGVSLALSLLLAGFALSSTILLMLGQISGVVIPLLAIGFACLLRDRLFWPGTLCLFAASMLKPQDAAFLVLYLLLAGPSWRKAFFRIAALSIVFVGLSLFWIGHDRAAANWLPELRANLAGASAPGNFNSPARGGAQGLNQTQLGSLFAVTRDVPAIYNKEALAASAVLFALWLLAVLRLPDSTPKHLLALAALACFTLLPVYHRQYDTRMLLFAFPAVAFLLGERRHRVQGLVGLLLLGAATVLTSHQYINRILLHQQAAIRQAGVAKTLLCYRFLPEVALVLFLYFVVALYRMEPRLAADRPVEPGGYIR